MNDTIGKNEHVPSRLVFKILPLSPIIRSCNQKDRIDALEKAQIEMNAIIFERRGLAALTRNIPHASEWKNSSD